MRWRPRRINSGAKPTNCASPKMPPAKTVHLWHFQATHGPGLYEKKGPPEPQRTHPYAAKRAGGRRRGQATTIYGIHRDPDKLAYTMHGMSVHANSRCTVIHQQKGKCLPRSHPPKSATVPVAEAPSWRKNIHRTSHKLKTAQKHTPTVKAPTWDTQAAKPNETISGTEAETDVEQAKALHQA
ncbi:Hypothetical predicted protein [Pelobates cultripes]|uniref:Uncharacterized protein n=1 Tax=Pelobates cultripes TaxID=61616 RepID=A0AAD1WHZ9_PELCU|nr:Hypothetical predicted protein [Pelobates cultripes]